MHHKRRRTLEKRGFTRHAASESRPSPTAISHPETRSATPPTLPATPPRDAVVVSEVRAWARNHGLAVPTKGRLRSEIWTAWHAAHPNT
jgi:hypothetical protein